MDNQRARELIAAAVTWSDEGGSVVPAQPQSKKVYFRWRQLETVQLTVNHLRVWFGNGIMNLALVCGTGNLLVLDFDDLARYKDWILLTAGKLGETYTESTGRGMHLFYKVDRPESKHFLECEALGMGHLCLVAPSIHPSGAVYKAVGDPFAPIIQTKTDILFSLLSKPETRVNPLPDREKFSKAVRANNIRSGGDLIDRLKAVFPLLSYVETLTELKPSGENGRWLIGRCPFHEDEEPSFWVDAKRGLWGCYSPSCKGSKGGDVLNLYALANNLTIGDAIKRLVHEVL